MAIDERTWTAIGTGALLTAGTFVLVASVFWIESAAVAVPALVVGAGLLGLGAFYPRVAGTIEISRKRVAIPVVAAYREVKQETLEQLSGRLDQVAPKQLLEFLDVALAEIESEERELRRDAVVSPGTIRAEAKVFEPGVVREAVARAADSVLTMTSDNITLSVDESADIEKRDGD